MSIALPATIFGGMHQDRIQDARRYTRLCFADQAQGRLCPGQGRDARAAEGQRYEGIEIGGKGQKPEGQKDEPQDRRVRQLSRQA